METAETNLEKIVRKISEENNPYAKECPNRHLWSEGFRSAFYLIEASGKYKLNYCFSDSVKK